MRALKLTFPLGDLKMLPVKRSLLAALLVLVAVPSFGKEVIKQARANDVASEYQLKDNGDLFRVVNGRKCQVTNNVLEFKISQHAQDTAMIYFIKDENTPNLYVLHNAERTGNCPKANKTLRQTDIDKKNGDYRYIVVSNPDSTFASAVLSRNGDFSVWSDTTREFLMHNVAEFVKHNQFGVRGAPFSSYVLFALNDNGYVLKVKGSGIAASSFDFSERYADLKEFKSKYKIDQN